MQTRPHPRRGRQTYEQQRDQLREDIALAEIDLADAVVQHLDVEGVLAFAEHLLLNVDRLWMTVGLDEKQKLQQVVFPEGLRFDGEKFGTAITCLAFKQLREDGRAESDLASHGNPNWNQIHAFLQQMARLREVADWAA